MNAIDPPKGVFAGQNFMTPNIAGYFKLASGYAELSEGRGIDGAPIFGVTVRPDARELSSKRSRMFHSRRAAMDYIEELS